MGLILLSLSNRSSTIKQLEHDVGIEANHAWHLVCFFQFSG